MLGVLGLYIFGICQICLYTSGVDLRLPAQFYNANYPRYIRFLFITLSNFPPFEFAAHSIRILL